MPCPGRLPAPCFCPDCCSPRYAPDDEMSDATVIIPRSRRPLAARALDLSPIAGPWCRCGSPDSGHGPHPVSPSTSYSASPRTPAYVFYTPPLDGVAEEGRAYSLAPMLLPPSMNDVMPKLEPLPLALSPSVSLSESAPLAASGSNSAGPLIGLLRSRPNAPLPVNPPVEPVFNPAFYSLLNRFRDAYDSTFGTSDASACPAYCWVCYPDDSVPANMEALDRDDVLRYIARIAGHGTGVFADGLRLALKART